MELEIKNLHVRVENTEILHGIDLVVPKGKVIAIMGPNGSGKSTLANTIGGHPKYEINDGDITLDGDSILEMNPDERARRGLFLSMQYAPEIPGVTIANFLRLAASAVRNEKINPIKFYDELTEKMKALRIDPEFMKRYLNVGFSGGEKKRLEMLQLAVLNPAYAILDETDSGLDVDALKTVAEGINHFRGSDKGILLITHYNRILEYVVPDEVHIMMGGKIVKSGGAELAQEIETSGYAAVLPPNRLTD